MAEGQLKRISKPPPCGTGGHKHGHKAGPEASDEEHARPSPRYTRQPKVQKRYMLIIPTDLVNGSEGIGTGWSSYNYYNPKRHNSKC
ncbi:hypothetical protein CFP56_018352, partial [Quercus suber]